jgi:uncharacterized membrane protein YbhN (UPF0104 family)
VTSDQPEGPLLVLPQTGALFGATGSYNSPGVLFGLVPPAPGGNGWTESVLSPPNSLSLPSVGVMSGVAIYGTDAGMNIVWSLTR